MGAPMNPILDKATTTVAAGAVVSPWWLPSLAEISNTAAQLLPIAGLCWIIVQFIVLVFRRSK